MLILVKILKKPHKEAEMFFIANIDRRKTNPLCYVKYWKQGCLPSLLFGFEIFSLTATLLSRLERCQRWFLKVIFYVPKFASSILIERLAGVNSVESEVEFCKLLFIGRLLSLPNIPITVKKLFRTTIESFYNEKISSVGVFSTIFEAFCKHDLLIYLEQWHRTAIFPTYKHPNMEISRVFLENTPSDTFWSISNKFPDVVKHLH